MNPNPAGAAGERGERLALVDVIRRFDDRVALNQATVSVGAGEIVGLLGANGAGKSTLLRVACGLLLPDAGMVRVGGVPLWNDPVAAKRILGYAAEEPSFYDELSAHEYLTFVASVRHLDPDAARGRTADLVARLGLESRMDEPVGQWSHGMRKKLSLLAAIVHRPALVLCDEALEGFDAPALIAAKDELRTLAHSGSGILFSSHVTESVERLCDRVVILDQGRVARSLARADWGGGHEEVSALERAFLEVARPAVAT
jgi:ABC-2 type transport system ATP-binding protein